MKEPQSEDQQFWKDFILRLAIVVAMLLGFGIGFMAGKHMP